MDPNETMVENEINQEADDTLQESGLIEEKDESEESLESFLEDDEGQKPKEESKPDQPPASEPGWIRKRVDKAVQKAVAETEARMQAMFNKQMAPIREKMMEAEAEELVRTGAVKDLKTAKELVWYRQGRAPEPERNPQPRNELGQFQPRQDPAVTARINMLSHQAEAIKAKQGIDVTAEFMNNEDVKARVVSGELDFYDVAEMMKQPQRKPPAPVRSPNGASGYQSTPISSMSDEAFEKLERRLREGARISMRK